MLFGNGVLNKIKNKKKFIQVNIITYSHVEHLEGGWQNIDKHTEQM